MRPTDTIPPRFAGAPSPTLCVSQDPSAKTVGLVGTMVALVSASFAVRGAHGFYLSWTASPARLAQQSGDCEIEGHREAYLCTGPTGAARLVSSQTATAAGAA